MKDQGVAKQILGIKVHKDGENGMLWLSQYNSMDKILMMFSMNIMKPINIPLAFHCKLSSSLSHDNKEENGCISHIPYASIVESLMYVIKWSRLYISHVNGVAIGHMENPSKEH